jgi:quinohemoprotein ethanol dehydrogenase
MHRLYSVAAGISFLCAGAFSQVLAGEPGAAANWLSHGGGDDAGNYSRLDQINATNVDRLGLAWSLDLPGEQILEATPLAVNGVLYFTGHLSMVYAVDGVSGKLLWSYDPQVWKQYPEKLKDLFAINRGVAYADGRVFAGTHDGRLISLDAKTGKLLWEIRTLPGESRRNISGAPLTFKGKVLIGNSGGDYGERGYVTAYDQKTGKQLWRFYTVPGSPEENKGDPAMEAAAKTWSGEYWKTGTGGTVWHGLTFDPELNLLYIGTGNSGPYDPRVRSPGNGDNLYLVSIVALNPDTGKYVWHYQMNPREAWDYKATANMIAATVTVEGKSRKVIMQAPTNGFYYVIDRTNGKLISAEKIGKVTWAKRIDLATGRPVEEPNIRYETGETILYPAPSGAHNWQDMSFSPKTGLAYIPYMQNGARFIKDKVGSGGLGGAVTMLLVAGGAEDDRGALLAWDVAKQKPRWKIPREYVWNGGTLATAGNLVFQGTAVGGFHAYNAETGQELWKFYAGLGIIAAPVTYEVNGKQYISVLVGYGASNMLGGRSMNIGWKFNAQPRRLETFVLDGKAKLPATPAPTFQIDALDDPTLKIDEADVAAGHDLFTVKCAVCHGLDTVSAGAPAPDLRESQIALEKENIWTIVHEGTLLPLGMPQFKDLSEAQVRQIHAFIRAKARDSLGLRKPEAQKAKTGAVTN